MDSRKIVFEQTLMVVIGQVICIAAMFGIFALLHSFDEKVLFGGLMGGFLSVINFVIMAIVACLAADKAQQQDVKGGQKMLQLSQVARYLLIFIVLIAVGVSGYFNLISTALPFVFVRPILTIAGFFRRKEA